MNVAISSLSGLCRDSAAAGNEDASFWTEVNSWTRLTSCNKETSASSPALPKDSFKPSCNQLLHLMCLRVRLLIKAFGGKHFVTLTFQLLEVGRWGQLNQRPAHFRQACRVQNGTDGLQPIVQLYMVDEVLDEFDHWDKALLEHSLLYNKVAGEKLHQPCLATIPNLRRAAEGLLQNVTDPFALQAHHL